MKTSITRLRSSFIILSLLVVSQASYASLVAKVESVTGEVFGVSGSKTFALKKGAELEAGSDILISDGAQLTFRDYYDRTYYLNSGSSVKIEEQVVTLKTGSMWTQSKDPRKVVKIKTVNSLIEHFSGECIVDFNQGLGRTQVLVISGELDISNPQDKTFKFAVGAGLFTFVDPHYDNGYPRTPTMVGLSSLLKTVEQFKDVTPLDTGLAKAMEKSKTARTAASATEITDESKSGAVVFIKTTQTADRSIASVGPGEALKYMEEKSKPSVKKMKAAQAPKIVAQARVRIFGLSADPEKTISREPTSVKSEKPASSYAPSALDQNFQESLRQQFSKQPPHIPEVQHLIDDLKAL